MTARFLSESKREAERRSKNAELALELAAQRKAASPENRDDVKRRLAVRAWSRMQDGEV